MPFSGQGTAIADADDVSFSALTNGQIIRYNSATSKWNNVALSLVATDIAVDTITEPKLATDTSPGAGQVLGWNGTSMTWQSVQGGGGSSIGPVTVASADAPAAVRARADFQCSGTNDQAIINQALQRASRAAEGQGGVGLVGVQLVGPNFYVGNNGTGAITMLPATHLFGSGPGTLIQPMWPTNTDRGAIELFQTTTAHVRVSHLTIGRTGSIAFNGHGIKFVGAGEGAASPDIQTGNDPFNWIDNVTIIRAARKGIWLTGTSGGSRESQLSHCVFISCMEEGLCIDSSSDSQISDCIATGGGSGPRFYVSGGNTKIAQCAAYRAGADTGATGADGFVVDSSRCEVTGCYAGDCGRWGFDIATDNGTIFGCTADSNSRLQTTGGGFQIRASCEAEGLVAYDRNATPASRQMRGIVITSSPRIMLSGYVSVPAGGTAVTGTPGANSFVRVVRAGGSVYSIGA